MPHWRIKRGGLGCFLTFCAIPKLAIPRLVFHRWQRPDLGQGAVAVYLTCVRLACTIKFGFCMGKIYKIGSANFASQTGRAAKTVSGFLKSWHKLKKGNVPPPHRDLHRFLDLRWPKRTFPSCFRLLWRPFGEVSTLSANRKRQRAY